VQAEPNIMTMADQVAQHPRQPLWDQQRYPDQHDTGVGDCHTRTGIGISVIKEPGRGGLV
jgi:hypothetical protein